MSHWPSTATNIYRSAGDWHPWSQARCRSPFIVVVRAVLTRAVTIHVPNIMRSWRIDNFYIKIREQSATALYPIPWINGVHYTKAGLYMYLHSRISLTSQTGTLISCLLVNLMNLSDILLTSSINSIFSLSQLIFHSRWVPRDIVSFAMSISR